MFWSNILMYPCNMRGVIMRHLGYVWNPESTRQRKKIFKENDFHIFGFTLEKIKENQI